MQEQQAEEPKGLSKAAIAILMGGNGFDAAGTYGALRQPGVREMNPLLGDDPNGVLAGKIGLSALQYFLLNHFAKQGDKSRKVANIVAAISGGLGVGLGARNFGIMNQARKRNQ